MTGAVSEAAKRRIRDAVSTAIDWELTAHLQVSGSESSKADVIGPWSMLDSASSVWEATVRLSADLFREIHGRLSDTDVKEILLAAAGVKVSRLCVRDADVGFLRSLADRHGFCVLVGQERYLPRRDVGKGNYCNAFERIGGLADPDSLSIVHVASDSNLAVVASLLEEAGDDELFGTLLGIPNCCRAAYERARPAASAKQFDLMPAVLENSAPPLCYDWWLNYASIYFGRSLLGFFPCSFRCAAARRVATSTYNMLAECDEAWALSFVELQRSNILYTEYQGVHLFRQPVVDAQIHYGSEDILSTAPTEVSALIRKGDRLDVCGKHLVRIYSGAEQIGCLQGNDIGMCVFFDKRLS
jgi:hypothetical protein